MRLKRRNAPDKKLKRWLKESARKQRKQLDYKEKQRRRPSESVKKLKKPKD